MSFAMVGGAIAGPVKCPSCQKIVDDSNKSCPYCLNDLSAPMAPATEQVSRGRGARAAGARLNIPVNAQAEKSVSEQQVEQYIKNSLLPSIEKKYGAKFSLETVRRSSKNMAKFEVVGKAYSQYGTPLKSVSYLMEALTDSPCFSQVNLDRATRKDINDQNVFLFTLSMKAEPVAELVDIKAKPEVFEFAVPAQPGEQNPETMYLVKILKKFADSESTVFEMPKKAGEKVTLTIVPEAGSSLVVMIDGNRVYEKKY